MGFIRPATPGFIVTLVATILLAVVSFCVPYFKSVYFLKASTTVEGISGSITFGTLGYCLEVSNVTTCSKPSIGYELDINSLVGNKFERFQIPQVAVKWVTYALFAHVVALALAAGSSVFGLLAHVREMSMTCCSTCVSGFAAAVALLAFIFDLVLFFVAKSRINAVGTAEIGNAIWLTLAAWVLLFFSGCFYALGRCCVSRRPKGGSSKRREGSTRDDPFEPPKSSNNFTDRLRLDAVKAEADRKARERQAKEVGLPAFAETQPLTARVEGDHVYLDDDSKDAHSTAPVTPNESANSRHRAAAGYVQGAAGSRAVDDYYNTAATTSPPMPNTYPPQRQASGHAYPPPSGYEGATAYAPPQRQPSGYAASSYSQTGYGAGYHSTSPPPMPTHSALAVPGQFNDPYDPYGGQQYGHAAGGSSYHTAVHSQNPSHYDPYAQTSTPPQPEGAYYSPQPHQNYGEQPAFIGASRSDPYMQPASPPAPYRPAALTPGYGHTSPPPSNGYQTPQRQYTLGGDGYGGNSVPPLADDPYAAAYPARPPGVDTSMGGYSGQASPAGPRAQPEAVRNNSIPQDSPPGYEQGASAVTGQWGKH
ncbi:SUR7/PalI family-domain-containing protein [Coprinopsis sp. MPI-PUGE-AT-0042]|nr:SUR7/PalI family-domain-containing protein [Coprinopsis sp. MPI-PUGE-AT-0042]